jgi:hypothetical protein
VYGGPTAPPARKQPGFSCKNACCDQILNALIPIPYLSHKGTLMDKTADHDFEHKICFRPSGFVSNESDETTSRQELRKGTSRIVLDKQWAEGLDGLEPGQLLLVIFHFDRIREGLVLRQHPRGDQARPKRGVFALRSPLRGPMPSASPG